MTFGTASHHGNAVHSGGTTITIAATADAGDILVIAVFIGSTNGTLPTATIAGASLSWTSIGSASNLMHSSDGGLAQMWWALAAGAVTAQTITVTAAGVTIDDAAIVYASFPGCNTTTPIDVNGSLPAKVNATGSAAATVAISTTAANTVALVLWGSNLNTPILPLTINNSGVIVDGILNSGGTFFGAIELGTILFTSAQTSTTVGYTNAGTTQFALVISALQQGGSTLSATVAESGGASDTPSATATFAALIGETGTALDTTSETASSGHSIAENGSASVTTAVAASTWAASVATILSASDLAAALPGGLLTVNVLDFFINRGGGTNITITAGDPMTLGTQFGSGGFQPFFAEATVSGSQCFTGSPFIGLSPGFDKVLMSIWLRTNDITMDNTALGFQIDVPDDPTGSVPTWFCNLETTGFLNITDEWPNIPIQLGDAAQENFWSGTGTPVSSINHLLMSFDNTAGLIGMAYNGVPITPDFAVTAWAGALQNPVDFIMNFANGGFAEWWMDTTSIYRDATDPTIIAKFYSAGNPVNLGFNGTVPFGNLPSAYYSIQGAAPIPPVSTSPAIQVQTYLRNHEAEAKDEEYNAAFIHSRRRLKVSYTAATLSVSKLIEEIAITPTDLAVSKLIEEVTMRPPAESVSKLLEEITLRPPFLSVSKILEHIVVCPIPVYPARPPMSRLLGREDDDEVRPRQRLRAGPPASLVTGTIAATIPRPLAQFLGNINRGRIVATLPRPIAHIRVNAGTAVTSSPTNGPIASTAMSTWPDDDWNPIYTAPWRPVPPVNDDPWAKIPPTIPT